MSTRTADDILATSYDTMNVKSHFDTQINRAAQAAVDAIWIAYGKLEERPAFAYFEERAAHLCAELVARKHGSEPPF